MVRTYVKKSNRCLWSEGEMQLAIQKVVNGLCCKNVAMEYVIPRSTLQNRITQLSDNPTQVKSNQSNGNFSCFNYN